MIDSAVKTKSGKENIKAYEYCEDIPFPILHFKELQRNHKIYKYATEYITLDTETSKTGQVDEELQVYNEMRDYFVSMTKGIIINLSDKDFISYGLEDETIRSLNNEVSFLHSLKFSKTKGSKIDTIWSELSAATSSELSPFIDNPADMLYELREYIYRLYDKTEGKENTLTGWVYQWAMKLHNTYIYGRKPSQIIDTMSRIAEHYKLTDKKRILIFIHNMPYDYQYLKWYFSQYDPTMQVFAIDNHHTIKIDLLGFRILCSYKITNLSLAKLSESYSEKYIKAVGEIDYNVTRYQDTKLSKKDWFYMFSDVASQYDGIRQYIKSQGYTFIASAPITSTGFVRKDCQKASKKEEGWRDMFLKMQLDLEQYNLFCQAFMGGLTICSYKYSNKTIRSNRLRHKDFTSSYPARQMLDYFPTGAATWYGEIDDKEELQYLLDTYCCVFILHLEDVHIKEGITAPYIPSSKCIHSEDILKLNGKVVFAKSLSIAITEIDYKWITRQYDFKSMKVTHMCISNRGTIPQWLKNKVMEYFNDKCTLKGVDDLLYMKQKNRLNGIYGMTATKIIRESYELEQESCELLHKIATEDEQKQQLAKYYRSYNSFLPYQYSLYTTAHARDALMTMIEVVGYDNFIYCDTDSVFYLETDENKRRMEKYQAEQIERAKNAGAYVGNKYLGAAEDEPPLRAIRPLHAKCYAIEEYNKKSQEYELNVIIAGIPKKAIVWEDGEPHTVTNAEELGSIDNLQDGFVFRSCGGSRAIYIEDKPTIAEIDGHTTEYASACIIENIEKEINDTMWSQTSEGYFVKLLQNL